MANMEDQIKELALKAKDASKQLAATSTQDRNDALCTMAQELRKQCERILEANGQDMEDAKASGVKESFLDRLMLDEERIEAIAAALEDLVAFPDPLNNVLKEDTLYNGIKLEKVTVPLGVVAVVYEARPNVTADAAGICIKSGNTCILRGGKIALRSCLAITHALQDALVKCGLSKDCIVYIDTPDRSATDALMQLHGIVDVLIPRGGAGLISHCVETSKVPVIETGTGNCHVYVHESADADMARSIVVNSKCRRLGVCNAAETLLLDDGISDDVARMLMVALSDEGITLHADDRAYDLAIGAGVPQEQLVHAEEDDWGHEYLSADITVGFIGDVDSAIDHINRYGTHHSESIVSEDAEVAEKFLRGVDAAAVYHNAATAFTDGGQFGLGAEIGISTQKLHARGPFALEALTSYKYVLRGNGQTRS